jgi:Predicted glycosyl hydrolase
MVIHVVHEGETIQSIADQYMVPVDRLIIENELKNPNNLALGETIVVLYPDITYVIQEGDTLGNIATKYNVSVLQLLRNNPYLSERQYIYPGETIVVSYKGDKTATLSTNGYAYPFIDMDILKKTLPFLTYLSIYSYQISADGNIQDINDADIIKMAKEYNVAPIMVVEVLAQNQTEEINTIHSILNDQEKQERLSSGILGVLKEKGYYGVSINTSYILPKDRDRYFAFVKKLATRIKSEGFKFYDNFSLSTFELLTETIYEGLKYDEIGKIVDGITLISYEYGYSVGIPSGTVSFDAIEEFINYMIKLIHSEKIDIGVLDIGYIWKLPYEPGVSKGMSISYETAIAIALENNAEILFDDSTKSAYFHFIASDEFVVRFWDARGIDAYTKLVPDFKLNGVGIWNIMLFFSQMWLVINSQYEIEKVQI